MPLPDERRDEILLDTYGKVCAIEARLVNEVTPALVKLNGLRADVDQARGAVAALRFFGAVLATVVTIGLSVLGLLVALRP